MPPPELDLLGVGGLIGDGPPLPRGIVGILHRHLAWTGIAALGERPIERIQFIQQQTDGQSVRDDMMQVEDQHVFRGAELEHGDANQWQTRQVERADRFLRRQGLQPAFALVGGQVIQCRHIDRDRQLRMDALDRLTVLESERGSQDLVPLDDFIDTAFQRRHVQRAAQTISVRQVIRRIARRQLIDHPHLTLGKRQRGPFTIGPCGYLESSALPGRSPLQALLQQRLLYRRKV